LDGKCILKHDFEGKVLGWVEVTGGRERRHKQLMDNLMGKEWILDNKRGSTRSQFVENSQWNWLWMCRKANCIINELINE
jgi:hypothetical protein